MATGDENDNYFLTNINDQIYKELKIGGAKNWKAIETEKDSKQRTKSSQINIYIYDKNT